MELIEFRKKRFEERKKLLTKIVAVFASFHPAAIHLFGSGVSGFKDEFSDIDIWITFDDNKVDERVKHLNKILREIAPVLIRHHSKSWSPVEGSANSVIFDTEAGPFAVDLYISKRSKTIVKENSKVLFGDDNLKRGQWQLNKNVDSKIRDLHTLRTDSNLLVDLLFVGIKGIIRKWDDDNFVKTLRTVHKNFRKRYPGKIKRRQVKLNFTSEYKLLSDIYGVSNKTQKRAIKKIRAFMRQVEALY